MSRYLIEIGESLAKVLENALSSQPEQLAGYFANVDFWIGEYRHLVSVSVGFEVRFKLMSQARHDYLATRGGAHNLDDCGEPYQGVVKTTSQQDRNAILVRCRTAVERLIERALRYRLIDIERHDDLLAQISRRTPAV